LLELSPTYMTLELADRLISRPTGRALIDVFEGELTLRVRKEAITFNLDQTSRYSANYNDMTANRIDVIDMACEDYSQEVLGFSDLLKIIQLYWKLIILISTLRGDILLLQAFLNDDPSLPQPNQGNYLPQVRKELKICEAKTNKSSIDEPPEVELKDLPLHLEYVFLEGDDKFPVIIAKDLSIEEKIDLITVLKLHKRVIAWKLSDIKGINPEFCTHKILLEEDFKPVVQHQRRVNPKIHDVIKKEVFKPLDAGLIYPISDSPWMLKRCEDTNLYLNWEKIHFIVKEGIVLGHKISKNGIEVDKAKVDVIAKLPHPTTVRGVVPEKLQENHFRPIHYASKTMTEAELNYTTTEKEMLAVVYAFEKLQSYLIMNKSIVYTNHSALKYLFAKKDSKARLLRWVLLLQEFKFKVIDTKGAENLAADHLSRLENPHQNVLDPKEINESFPLETLNMVSFRGNSSTPWFADFAKYHARNFVVKGMSFGTPRAIISDHGTHFNNDQIEKVVLKYGVTHRLATAYHPQTSGQDKTKRLHDSKIKDRVFNIGDQVLLFNSRLKIFSGKLKTHWFGPLTITHVFPYGTVELSQTDVPNFKVNGHGLKHYFREDIPKMVVPDLQTFPKDQ
nr:reverse transcriptase domain-containing protein [Tanacetum cinerariifolium]